MFVVITPFLIRDSHLSQTNLMRQCLMSTVPLQPHMRRCVCVGVRACVRVLERDWPNYPAVLFGRGTWAPRLLGGG